MSNTRQYVAQWIGPFSNVETFHQGGAAAPGFGQFPAFPNSGTLGARVIVTESPSSPGSKEYQLLQIDSGATSATPTGAIAQGQLMYWKDRAKYLVTNDVRFSDWFASGTRNGVNSAAGVLVTPTTGSSPAIAGDTVYLQTKGRCDLILSAQASPSLGDWAIPNNSLTVPQINNVAVGTAPGDTVVGRYRSVTVTSSVASVDLQLPEIP